VRLLEPGGLVLNHGITAGSLTPSQLGAGMGEFIEKYIFPGGELLHVSHVLRDLSAAGLEMVDTENLRPHYARTLSGLVGRARSAAGRGAPHAGKHARPGRRRHGAAGLPHVPVRLRDEFRARLGVAAPDPRDPARRQPDTGNMRGAQSAYPFNRDYIYR
jgi:cyclopropane-fatty-acyl-phospholipid synthase